MRAAQPFLSWAGSKRRFINKLTPHLPPEIGRYYEPFLGGGSLYFLLNPSRATIGDLNHGLVETYRTVRDDVEAVISALKKWHYQKEEYYRVRDHYQPRSASTKAARFIYLNKTCWNGLYRESRDGHFNVPFGRRNSPDFLDDELLRACSRALKGAALRTGDFAATTKDAVRGDFVYFDPPYVTSHNNNGFVHYNARLFTWQDQLRLAKEAQRLARMGVNVWVTNAAHAPLTRLYNGFRKVAISRSSTIAGDSSARGTSREVLLLGGPFVRESHSPGRQSRPLPTNTPQSRTRRRDVS